MGFLRSFCFCVVLIEICNRSSGSTIWTYQTVYNSPTKTYITAATTESNVSLILTSDWETFSFTELDTPFPVKTMQIANVDSSGTLIMVDYGVDGMWFFYSTDGGHTFSEQYMWTKGIVKEYSLIAGLGHFVLYPWSDTSNQFWISQDGFHWKGFTLPWADQSALQRWFFNHNSLWVNTGDMNVHRTQDFINWDSITVTTDPICDMSYAAMGSSWKADIVIMLLARCNSTMYFYRNYAAYGTFHLVNQIYDPNWLANDQIVTGSFTTYIVGPGGKGNYVTTTDFANFHPISNYLNATYIENIQAPSGANSTLVVTGAQFGYSKDGNTWTFPEVN